MNRNAAIAVVAAVVLLGLGWLALGRSEGPAVVPPPVAPRPAPVEVAEPADVAAAEVAPAEGDVGAPEPAPRAVGTDPVQLELDERKAMQGSIDKAIRSARTQCFNAWLATPEGDPNLELVLDAVVREGRVSEVTLRPLGDIPEEVVSCARDTAWTYEWPELVTKGELRFQRVFKP